MIGNLNAAVKMEVAKKFVSYTFFGANINLF